MPPAGRSCFQSAAYDLVTNDFNRNGDVFVVNLFAAGMIPVFYVQAISGTSSSLAPTLVWPVLAGKTYLVLYKNNLTDPLLAGHERQHHNTGQHRLFHQPQFSHRTTVLSDRGN